MTSKLLHCRTTPTTVLANIVNVSLDRREDNFSRGLDVIARGLGGLDERQQVGATAFFITLALFTTWGRNILPDPNRSPTTFIPSISGPSITCRERSAINLASSVSSSIWSAIPLTSAWLRRSCTVPFRHCSTSTTFGRAALDRFGKRDQPIGRLRVAIQHHILDDFEQVGGYFIVNAKLTRVDDRHVESGLERVVEETPHGSPRAPDCCRVTKTTRYSTLR